MMKTVDQPEHIQSILRRLASAGREAYLVGGCVRDSVMGRAVHDWDVATSAVPDEIIALFEKTVPTGMKYGTVTVVIPGGAVEVTAFRTESGYTDGRHPGTVTFASSLEEDLSRRDFTMNAIAVSRANEMIDPYGGLEDIEKKVVRCVGEPDTRFAEDALRMFRAFRFSAELDFAIAPETLTSIVRNADKAAMISAERVRTEVEKTLLSHRPEVAGEIVSAGLLDSYLTKGRERPASLQRLAAIKALPAEPAPRWCAFCAILADKGLIEDAGTFLRGLRLDANTVRTCKAALTIIGMQNSFNMSTAAATAAATDAAPSRVAIKRLLAKHGADAVRCAAAARDALRGGSALTDADEIINSGECFSLDALAITGSDLLSLGRPRGREIGETLALLLDYVIQRPDRNNRATLLKYIEETGKK